MKVKIGNKTTALPKEVVASHMANMLATRSVVLGKDMDFKKSFSRYKDLCLLFLKENKKYVYSFGKDEEFYDDFVEFQSKQHELLIQELYFKFSDGSEWTVFLNDIVNIKLMIDPDSKDRNYLLSHPLELAEWAQNTLTWNQIKDYCILRNISGNEDAYINEWATTNKKVLQYQYKHETEE